MTGLARREVTQGAVAMVVKEASAAGTVGPAYLARTVGSWEVAASAVVVRGKVEGARVVEARATVVAAMATVAAAMATVAAVTVMAATVVERAAAATEAAVTVVATATGVAAMEAVAAAMVAVGKAAEGTAETEAGKGSCRSTRCNRIQ